MIRLGCVLILLSAATPSAGQTPPSSVVVTAQELNVRAGPSSETPIITKLLQGQRVLARPGDGPWANVAVLVDGKMIEGWVNRSYIAATAPSGSPTSTPPNVFAMPPAASQALNYPAPLTSDSADLDCDEDFIDGGFSQCTVEISISLFVPRIYTALLKDYVEVGCEASVSFETADGYLTSERASESTSVYLSGGTGSESIKIDFDPFSMSPIVRARIDDVKCEIQ